MIDVHVHGISGYDTRTSKPEDISGIAGTEGRAGVSAFLPTIYPASIERMRADMEAARKAMRAQKKGGSAWIAGVHLEGPFLNPSKSGALDRGSLTEPTEYNLDRLIDGYEDMIKIVTIAPEIDGALGAIKKLSDMGITASMGHSNATYAEAEAGFNSGAKGITHIFNAMRGFHHREPGIAGFGLTNKEIYIEVIGDPYHLHPKTIELIFEVKNPDRIILISDSVKGPFRDEKGKLLGGEMDIAESSKRLIEMGIAKEAVLKAASDNPKRYLGL